MAIGLLDLVTSLIVVCSKHISRAAKKLRPNHARLSRQIGVNPCNTMHSFQSKKMLDRSKKGGRSRGSNESEDASDAEEEKLGVWRKSILMGEKCDPLNFSGVIYYDCDGNRLAEIPTPRASPMRTPLKSFSTFSSGDQR